MKDMFQCLSYPGSSYFRYGISLSAKLDRLLHAGVG